MITSRVRTKWSSTSHHCPTPYHHTWLSAMATSAAAAHRRNLGLERRGRPRRSFLPDGSSMVSSSSGPDSYLSRFLRRQSRYSAASRASTAAPQ